MESVIYYHRKYGEAAVPFILTIQSKEIGPSHIRRFRNSRIYIPQQTLRRMSQLLNTYTQKKKNPKFSRKTATESHEKCVLTCSFSLKPEFSQKIDNPPALIIIFPMEEYIHLQYRSIYSKEFLTPRLSLRA